MSNRAAAVRTEPFQQDLDLFQPRGRELASSPRIRHAGEDDQPGANLPAELQRDVAVALALGAFDPRQADAREPGKWSSRQTVAFCLVTCGTFWALFAWAMVKLF